MSTSEFCFFSYTRTSYPLFTSRNRYIRRLIVFRGAGLVTNLCRCNIYSPLFSWKTYNSTTDLLYYGDEPILSYIIGFAKASNLEKPVILPSNQWVKDVTLLPLGHEFERLTGAVAMLAKDPKLKAEFEEKLKDPAFAKSARARLYFFYERTPYFKNQKVGVYPVGRITDSDPLKAAIAPVKNGRN